MYCTTTNRLSVNGLAYKSGKYPGLLPPKEVVESEVAAIPDETVGQEAETGEEEVVSLCLRVSNVVVMANLRCHIDLKHLARVSVNVEYKPLQNVREYFKNVSV